MRAVKSYPVPGTRRFEAVDRALDYTILDRLNALPGLSIRETCAGHSVSYDRHARVLFQAPGGLRTLAPYLDALSATEYWACVGRYRFNGGVFAWHLEVRRAAPGEAPIGWWRNLVELLEDA